MIYWALVSAEQVQLSLETEFENLTGACSHLQNNEYFASAVPFAAKISEGSWCYNLGTLALSAACCEENCSWPTSRPDLWGSQFRGISFSWSLSPSPTRLHVSNNPWAVGPWVQEGSGCAYPSYWIGAGKTPGVMLRIWNISLKGHGGIWK